jgi:hypothetical protein
MAQHEELFKYDDLDLDEPSSIRLVQLLPPLPGSLLQCRMFHATTQSDYKCLSYMWGDPMPLHRISVNGKIMLVRENLFNFLDHASTKWGREDPPQSLWIDAICIDQENTTEKNHQVQRMGRIFSLASEVLV